MKITLKDGSVKEYASPMSIIDIAKDISEGLARVACLGEVDGEEEDLRTVIDHDCQLNILTAKDEKGLAALRHTASHVMAQAVKRLYPETKLAIGPSIADGFYYDVDPATPLTAEDLPKIEAEYDRLTDIMLERKKEGKPFTFFHFMVDLDQGPCVVKRLRGCGAGYEYVAVTPDGDIYPCHQFVGKDEFKQGSVLDQSFNMDIAQKFAGMNIYSRPKCQKCWAKFYCSGGCSAANYNMNHDMNDSYDLGCEMERKRLECAIYLKAMDKICANQSK